MDCHLSKLSQDSNMKSMITHRLLKDVAITFGYKLDGTFSIQSKHNIEETCIISMQGGRKMV